MAQVNDLGRMISMMTAAARAGLTPAQCMQRDLEQREAFGAWRREVDATKEIAYECLGVSALGVDLSGAGYAATTKDHLCDCDAGACLRDKISSMTPEEIAEMDGLGRVPRWPGNGAPDSTVAVGSQCTPDYPSLQSPDDAFNFAPACRELAAHFMPGAPGLSVDYLAQYLMDCVTDYLAIREEFRK